MTKYAHFGKHTVIVTVSAHNMNETHKGFNVWRTRNLSVRQYAVGTFLFAVTHCTPVR
jgi:hypothetical protein